eukprot:TRINITY_DN170270_c0_g1_i1.p1 TRINITY_DN170270_c0_g1~~TRINITY_DN170270_c0_g1_i1.p1  ORF type:complete len:189 (-),score=65.95 TRINITY_DN170270_c0_g1_i1:1199-1765(-)
MDWNQLVSASLGITVTDEAVRQMTEKRKLAPSLPALVLLDPEVDHLEDSEVYMAEGDEAKTRMDLLLGTQGWRRFSYSTPKEFEEETERKNQLRDQDMSDEEWKEKVNYLFGFSHRFADFYGDPDCQPPECFLLGGNLNLAMEMEMFAMDAAMEAEPMMMNKMAMDEDFMVRIGSEILKIRKISWIST